MKKFNITLNGYDKQEVNQFVGEVTREYELMLGKLKNKDKEISLLEEQLTHYKGLESTLNRAMLVAEDSSSQLKQVAKEEAKNIIEDAKKNASYIVNDALIKAEKIELEADQLRRSLKIYKARIKQTIEEQLTLVNDVDHIKLEREGEKQLLFYFALLNSLNNLKIALFSILET